MGYSLFDGTMADMTWEEIERSAQSGETVLWPVGVLEEHGPHMSIGVDIYTSYQIVRKTRENLKNSGFDSVIAPPNYWGINNVSGAFAGSFTLRKDTLKALMFDILASLKRWGYDKVFVISFHGDINHWKTVEAGVAEARLGCGVRAHFILSLREARYAGYSGNESHVLVTPETAEDQYFYSFRDIHAGTIETSFMQRYCPSQVNTETARMQNPTKLEGDDWKKWQSGWSDTRSITPKGYNGDPSIFDPEIGEKFIMNEAGKNSKVIMDYLLGRYRSPV